MPRPSQMITATITTCRMNDARQLMKLVTSPPIRGLAAAPIPAAPLTTPKYLARVVVLSNSMVMRM